MTAKLCTSTVASGLFLGLLLSTATGCGALQAVGNPKVAWAFQDPAPMTVVVRRADIADETVQEVNRLLTATPAGSDSEWLKHVGPDPKDAAQDLQLAGSQTMYAESHARVVAAEVWVRTLHQLKSTKGEHASLLATISPELADAYSSILGKKVEIAGISALIDQEKAALDAKDISADDKVEHTATLAKLQKMRSDSEADVAPLAKSFLATAGDAAGKLPADQKQKLAPAIANLLQALADADIANSAAAIRYPMALPSMLTSVKGVVPQILADIIEEKTGHRPDVAKLKAEVSLSGSDVSIKLAGMSPADLGALKLDDLTKEAIARTGKWVVHATSLLATVSATKEALSFQTDVLSQIMTSFGGTPAALAVQIPTTDASGHVTVAAAPTGGLGLTGSVPSSSSFGASAKLPGAPSAPKVTAGVHAPDVAVTAKLPGGPGTVSAAAGAKDPKAAATANAKVPGLGGALGAAGAAASMAKDPKGAAADLAKGAAGAAAARVPGLGGALAAAGTAANFAKDPKGAAADLAKGAAGAAAAKVPGLGGALSMAGNAADLAKDPKGAAAGLAKGAAGAAAAKVPGLGGFTATVK